MNECLPVERMTGYRGSAAVVAAVMFRRLLRNSSIVTLSSYTPSIDNSWPSSEAFHHNV